MTRLRFSSVGFALCAFVACDRPRAPTASASPCDMAWAAAIADTAGAPLTFSVCAVRDTVAMGSPVKVAVIVRNSGGPRPFRNDPGLFDIEIVDPAGDTLQRDPSSWEPGSLGTLPRVTLPRDGLIADVVTLTCARHVYAQSSPAANLPGQCDWRFHFNRVGDYQVRIRYHPVEPPGGIAPADSLEYPSLSSEPIVVHVKP